MSQVGLPELTCECCDQEPSVGVASIPGVPMSIAWGRKCLEADVVPYWIAVAQGHLCGGYDDEHMAEWCRDQVLRTLEYFGKTVEQYEADLAQAELDEANDPNLREPGG